jgi:DNA-binding transcriptional regulator GbsR (MarR family)
MLQGLPFKKGKSRKKFNNSFNVPSDKADEIFKLSNTDLVNRAHLEYKNWVATQRYKKDDPSIDRIKRSIADINAEVKENPEYKKLEEEFKQKKEELVSAELAAFKEELANVVQPFNEDISAFRNLFRLAMYEITKRKESKAWNI